MPKTKTKTAKASTKKAGTTLIITEKPQAAMKIAYALANIAPIAKKVGQVTYYEVNHNKEKILVGCAVGHLYNLAEIGKKKWPNFDLEWAPNYKRKGSEFTKKYLDVLKSLSKKADNFVVACDYDIEGEVIGLNALRFACNQKDAKRMKFSTLTKEDLNKAYDNLSPTLDWGLAYAGETRHYLDWYYGINISKALMAAMKKAGTFRILSAGRVQGPALALIVNKEREIQKFKSTPYWQVSIKINESDILLKNSTNIIKKEKLKEFENIKGKQSIAKTTVVEDKLPPQIPFDLTTLQLEAHRLCGFTPARTLQVAQKLYLAGVISYPRTSSQKLPTAISYDKILKKLPKGFTKFATKKQPIEGKKSDPAHPSVYPTGEPLPPNADDDQEKIYDLVVRRFINCFCDEAIIETKTIKVTVEKKSFTARGLEIKQKGWTAVYKSRLEEKLISDINGPVTIKELKIEEKETKPPYRYNDASIVSELSKRNLGTKATRSAIIETLKKRGYIIDKKLRATKLGIAVTETLEKNSPTILDEELTREFEEEIESIQKSKNGKEKEKEILEKAKTVLIKISKDLKKNESKIGKHLAKALGIVREEEREASKVVKCKKCDKGWISIRRSRFGQFLACNAYPDCKTTFSLPPYGLKKIIEDKKCEECEWPKFQSFQKGKRPWEFCANPECPTRKQQQSYSNNKSKDEAVTKPETAPEDQTKEKKSKVPTAKPTIEKSNKDKLKELAEKITKKSAEQKTNKAESTK